MTKEEEIERLTGMLEGVQEHMRFVIKTARATHLDLTEELTKCLDQSYGYLTCCTMMIDEYHDHQNNIPLGETK